MRGGGRRRVRRFRGRGEELGKAIAVGGAVVVGRLGMGSSWIGEGVAMVGEGVRVVCVEDVEGADVLGTREGNKNHINSTEHSRPAKPPSMAVWRFASRGSVVGGGGVEKARNNSAQEAKRRAGSRCKQPRITG